MLIDQPTSKSGEISYPIVVDHELIDCLEGIFNEVVQIICEKIKDEFGELLESKLSSIASNMPPDERAAREEEIISANNRVKNDRLDRYRKISVTACLSDNSSQKLQNISEIKCLKNTPDRSITSISINTCPNDFITVSISCGGDIFHGHSAKYSLSSSDSMVMIFSRKIEESFRLKMQWFWPITKFPVMHTMFASMGLMWGFSFINEKVLSSKTFEIVASAVATIWLFLISVAFLVFVSRSKLFPSTVFAIGHGMVRHNRMVAVHKVVGSGLILAIVASIISNYLTNWLQK